MTTTVHEFLESVQASISGGTNTVVDRVRAALVDKELEDRKAAVLTVLSKLQEARKDAKKIKPDQETYNADGAIVTSTFSKAKVEELKKSKELQDKLESAIVKALEGDFGKVKEMAK